MPVSRSSLRLETSTTRQPVHTSFGDTAGNTPSNKQLMARRQMRTLVAAPVEAPPETDTAPKTPITIPASPNTTPLPLPPEPEETNPTRRVCPKDPCAPD